MIPSHTPIRGTTSYQHHFRLTHLRSATAAAGSHIFGRSVIKIFGKIFIGSFGRLRDGEFGGGVAAVASGGGGEGEAGDCGGGG